MDLIVVPEMKRDLPIYSPFNVWQNLLFGNRKRFAFIGAVNCDVFRLKQPGPKTLLDIYRQGVGLLVGDLGASIEFPIFFRKTLDLGINRDSDNADAKMIEEIARQDHSLRVMLTDLLGR